MKTSGMLEFACMRQQRELGMTTAPIYSMTAFARQERRDHWGVLTCECRSVNHRYLEPGFRLPEALRELEMDFREQVRERLGRGKVDVQMRLELAEASLQSMEPDAAVLRRLRNAVRVVNEEVDNPAPVNPLDVLRWPGVLASAEPPVEEAREAARALFTATLDDLVAAREREGQRLMPLFEDRLDTIDQHVRDLKQRAPEWLSRQQALLRERLKEAAGSLDEDRLAQEIAVLAQKADVSEELDRLDAHVGEVRAALGRSGPVGRRLDFLMQELNREANTLSSKSNAAELTRIAVELKVLIEQMREQIQNVE